MEASMGIEDLVGAWPDDQPKLRRFFLDLTARAAEKPAVDCELVARAGVSYSFRAALENGNRRRPVFFLVDVVVSASEPWFLSVCFYEDEISDPEEIGNAVPQGLFGETGYCFDVEAEDPATLAYLDDRLGEAYEAARRK
ncbi:MAG: hypothetical protein KKB20_21940 [Proteobacteria bacterium]|nr:hypothetical protein [Pseudomonadota bacterium]